MPTPFPNAYGGFTEGLLGGFNMMNSALAQKRQLDIAQQTADKENKKAAYEQDMKTSEFLLRVQGDPNTSEADSIKAHNALVPIVNKNFNAGWTPVDTWSPDFTKAAKQASNILADKNYSEQDKLSLIQGIYNETSSAARERMQPMLNQAQKSSELANLSAAGLLSQPLSQTDPAQMNAIQSAYAANPGLLNGLTPEQAISQNIDTRKLGYLQNAGKSGEEVIKKQIEEAMKPKTSVIKGLEKGTNRQVSEDRFGHMVYADTNQPYKGGQLQSVTENIATLNNPTDTQSATIADKIAHGQANLKDISLRGAGRMKVMNSFFDQYPSGDFNKAEANIKFMQDPQNMKTQAFVIKLLPRFEQLQQKADALKSSNMPAFNTLANWWGRQIGKPGIVDFDSLKNALVQESESAMTGGSAITDVRLKMGVENIQAANSPSQMAAAIDNYVNALKAKKESAAYILYPWSEVRGEQSAPIDAGTAQGKRPPLSSFGGK